MSYEYLGNGGLNQLINNIKGAIDERLATDLDNIDEEGIEKIKDIMSYDIFQEISYDDYMALPEEEQNSGRYAVTGWPDEEGGGGGAKVVPLTWAAYEALPDSKYSDGIIYNITDREIPIDIERRVDTVEKELTADDGLKFAFGKDGDGNYGYYGADGSLIPFKSGASMDLLWENPSPTSGFNAQTINVDFSKYSYIAIEFEYSTDDRTGVYICRHLLSTDDSVGKSLGASTSKGSGTVWVRYTELLEDKSGIKFEQAMHPNGSRGSTATIPIAIYGIK